MACVRGSNMYEDSTTMMRENGLDSQAFGIKVIRDQHLVIYCLQLATQSYLARNYQAMGRGILQSTECGMQWVKCKMQIYSGECFISVN